MILFGFCTEELGVTVHLNLILVVCAFALDKNFMQVPSAAEWEVAWALAWGCLCFYLYSDSTTSHYNLEYVTWLS